MTYRDWKSVYVDKTRTLADVVAKTQIANRPQVTDNNAKNERILAKLEETRAELHVKGQIVYPPPKFDLSKFTFDIEHAQGGKHPHNVTEEDARNFIENAYFAIYSLKAESYNYYGKGGGAFVQPNHKKIRTAFKSDEYNPKIQRLIEVFENEIGKT